MKIPESIRICGMEYEIRFVENANDGNQLCYGVISYDESTIELDTKRKVSHEHRCQTLWHEILHGIAHHAKLEIQDEEKVVDVLAFGIYQVLQDNGRRLFDIVPEQSATAKIIEDFMKKGEI